MAEPIRAFRLTSIPAEWVAEAIYFIEVSSTETEIYVTGNDAQPRMVLQGTEGKSAYQVAVKLGFAGTDAEWLESLVGPKGNDGTNGIDGTNGTNGTNGLNGLSGGVAFVLEDRRTLGVAGGNTVKNGWRQRVLNTVVYDPLAIITLSSNTFTVTRACWIEYQLYVLQPEPFKARLANLTDSTYQYGVNGYSLASNVGVYAEGGGLCEPSKTYQIDLWMGRGVTNGNGNPQSLGAHETYSRVRGWAQ